jgi:restriction system protein
MYPANANQFSRRNKGPVIVPLAAAAFSSAVLLWATTATAELCKYVDKSGVAHYTASAPDATWTLVGCGDKLGGTRTDEGKRQIPAALSPPPIVGGTKAASPTVATTSTTPKVANSDQTWMGWLGWLGLFGVILLPVAVIAAPRFVPMLGRWLARTILRARDVSEVLVVPEWVKERNSDSSTDPVVKVLNGYDPKPSKPIAPTRPAIPLYPNTDAAAQESHQGPAVLDELLAMHRSVKLEALPVRFQDLNEAFGYPTPEKPRYPDEPKRPVALADPMDMPELRLPYYFIEAYGLPTWKRVLNSVVDVSNRPARDQFRSRTAEAEREIQARKDVNIERREAYVRAMQRYSGTIELMDREWNATLEVNAEAKREYEALVDAYLAKLRLLQAGLRERRREAVEEYLHIVLAACPLPKPFLRDAALQYDPANRLAVLDYSFPDFERLTLMRWTTTRHRDVRYELAPVTDVQRRKAVDVAIPSVCLVLGRALADADRWDLLDAFCINVYVDHIDRRTGQPKRSYVASMFATPAQLLALDLAEIDPIQCFAALKGKYARSALAYEPVQPIARIDMTDDRVVAPREVLAGLTEESNLAAMDWEEFEHLIRELFELEFGRNGSKVEITRASRDRGVDAIVFDPDPLRGGKYVIQAKRYTNTVDVSAVRDLYGTVVNEGANRGILVTTSHFGPDAYEFAKDKNLVLMPGPELLGLLQRHGYAFRIDLEEARRLARS